MTIEITARSIARQMLGASMLLALASPASAQTERLLVGMPVAPDKSTGLWEVRIWPFEGCSDCHSDPKDDAAYKGWRTALVNNQFDKDHPSSVVVHVVKFATVQTEESIDASQFSDLVAGCKLGSEGMLPSSKNGSELKSYAFRLDCVNDLTHRFVSISFRDHKMTDIYYLPEHPIWVVNKR